MDRKQSVKENRVPAWSQLPDVAGLVRAPG